MEDNYVIGVDIGSSNIKTIIFSLKGDIISQASEEIRELYPQGGWVEQDPNEIWSKFKLCVQNAVNKSGILSKNILGIGMDSNRCSLLLLDDRCNPVTNIITWRDTRSEKYVKDFYRNYPGLNIYHISGEQGRPQHSVFKIMWIKEHMPEVWKDTRYMLFSPEDFVLHKLLNKRVTSMSMAQSTGLFNINTLEWENRILDIINVDNEMLPSLHKSNEVVGCISGGIAAELGLEPNTPIVVGLCDATASQVGLGAIEEGKFSLSIGTCGAIRTFSPKPVYDRNEFAQIRCFPPYGYVPSCTVTDAGCVLKWFKNSFCEVQNDIARKMNIDCYELLDKEAGDIKAGSDGLIMLPNFTAASYAFKDINLSGMFLGIRNYHTRAHFTRSILEGVGYSFKYMFDNYKEIGYEAKEIRVGGGGAKSYLWRQIISDILGVPVRTTECEEASSLGAAIMAVLGLGIYKSLPEAVNNMVKVKEEVYPNSHNEYVYKLCYELYRELYSSMKETFRIHNEVVQKIM